MVRGTGRNMTETTKTGKEDRMDTGGQMIYNWTGY